MITEQKLEEDDGSRHGNIQGENVLGRENGQFKCVWQDVPDRQFSILIRDFLRISIFKIQKK